MQCVCAERPVEAALLPGRFQKTPFMQLGSYKFVIELQAVCDVAHPAEPAQCERCCF